MYVLLLKISPLKLDHGKYHLVKPSRNLTTLKFVIFFCRKGSIITRVFGIFGIIEKSKFFYNKGIQTENAIFYEYKCNIIQHLGYIFFLIVRTLMSVVLNRMTSWGQYFWIILFVFHHFGLFFTIMLDHISFFSAHVGEHQPRLKKVRVLKTTLFKWFLRLVTK